MFEHRGHRLIPRARFLLRVGRHAAAALSLILAALGVGVMGYRHFEHLGWLDALQNASFILSGMGPVTPVQSSGGKLFASVYALFAGIIFLTVAAVVFGPIVHRFLHRFHLEEEEGRDTSEPRK